jgi:hypothetical protein
MTALLAGHAAIGRNGKRRAMQTAKRIDGPAMRIMVKRVLTAAAMACIGFTLGSCAGGASEDGFSAYVADHWPHWAGGMPSDVPPRPGAPGYAQFIAHGQADQDVLPPPSGANAAAVPVKPVFQTAPSAPAMPAQQVRPVQAASNPPPAPTAPQSASEDTSVTQGGLY